MSPKCAVATRQGAAVQSPALKWVAIITPSLESSIIYCDETWPHVERLVRKALREGQLIKWPDGSYEWIEESEVWGDDWHFIEKRDPFGTGYLLKWGRVKYRESKDREVTMRRLPSVWRAA